VKKLPKATDSLLTRDDFRESVFARDGGKCVICVRDTKLALKHPELAHKQLWPYNDPSDGLHMHAQDAHHILERRLFGTGGYYLSNGASLCGRHHIMAEKTTLSVEEIRAAAGIVAPALPDHFYPDEQYDKWGNTVLANGQRTKGELFHDESVQKILKQGGVMGLFTDYVKYPRTLHFPWSPGATDDDRIHHDLSAFEGQEVVMTEKMDGENTSLYSDYYHARSLDSNSHPTQSWARAFHARMAYKIPAGWRVCAENLYAKHSIGYDNLDSFLLVFSIWNEQNRCISWDDTVEYCNLLDLKHVPVIYRGTWDEKWIRSYPLRDGMEGYVIRLARSFDFAEFRKVVGKYVRANHVQTTHHWKSQMVQPNRLKDA